MCEFDFDSIDEIDDADDDSLLVLIKDKANRRVWLALGLPRRVGRTWPA